MEQQKKTRTIPGSAATYVVLAIAFTMLGALAGGGMFTQADAHEAGGLDAVLASGDSSFFKNWISVEVKHPSCVEHPENPRCGRLQETWYVHNKVTELGFNYTRDVISGLGVPPINGSLNNWTVIELSTDGTTPAITDRTCASPVTGNGLDIARATTVIKQNTGNFTASKTFTVSGTQAGIQKVCLSNNTASGGYGLMASALISSTNVASGDTLIVNYSVASQSA